MGAQVSELMTACALPYACLADANGAYLGCIRRKDVMRYKQSETYDVHADCYVDQTPDFLAACPFVELPSVPRSMAAEEVSVVIAISGVDAAVVMQGNTVVGLVLFSSLGR